MERLFSEVSVEAKETVLITEAVRLLCEEWAQREARVEHRAQSHDSTAVDEISAWFALPVTKQPWRTSWSSAWILWQPIIWRIHNVCICTYVYIYIYIYIYITVLSITVASKFKPPPPPPIITTSLGRTCPPPLLRLHDSNTLMR